MKWCAAIATLSLAGAGFALAANVDAEAFILSHSKDNNLESSLPRLPRQLVRHILLQRLSLGDDHSSLTADLPDELELERAVTYLNHFGREPTGLFASAPQRPSMVLMLEGINDDNSRGLRRKLEARGQGVVFSVVDTPSARANEDLLQRDLVGPRSNCDDVAELANPSNTRCWSGSSLVTKHNVAENPKVLASLESNLDKLLSSTAQKDLDVMILLVPEATHASGPNEWTTESPSLRRRQFSEAVIAEHHNSAPVRASFQGQPAAAAAPSAAPARKIQNCFSSASACMNATDNCSGHGSCSNRFGSSDATRRADGDKKLVCFQCFCTPTVNDTKAGQSTTYWGGKTCAKQDVSSPFWLIVAVTVILVGLVSFSIGLLFSVGEEKLPGVIGAGVSKPTK